MDKHNLQPLSFPFSLAFSLPLISFCHYNLVIIGLIPTHLIRQITLRF